MEVILQKQYCRKALEGIKEKSGCVLFVGQYFYSSETSTVLSGSASYSAAIPGFMLSRGNICRKTILAPLTQRAYVMCLHAHVGVHATYICTCVLECLCVCVCVYD